MTSTHGYMDGSYDYKQMYTIQDLRGPLPIPEIHSNTLFGALASNPDVSYFTEMITKTQLIGVLNNKQGDFTLFVPLNSGIPQYFRDECDYKTRRLILFHMLEHAVPEPFIKGSRAMLVNTRIPGSKLLVENNPLLSPIPLINRTSQVIGSQKIGNAMIYFLDRIIVPDQNPLSNVEI